MTNRTRRRFLGGVAVGLLLAAAWLLQPRPSTSPDRPGLTASPPAVAPPAIRIEDPPASVDNPEGTGLRLAWPGVDLEEVRRALPDNHYWEHGAPTDDPDVLAHRTEAKAERNRQFGGVQSGTATEAEIDDYFDQRVRISEDYVFLTTHLLEHHGAHIPERDIAMLELARDMNAKRLLQLPTERERAHERRLEQVAARDATQTGGI